jgi:hypothetical protein
MPSRANHSRRQCFEEAWASLVQHSPTILSTTAPSFRVPRMSLLKGKTLRSQLLHHLLPQNPIRARLVSRPRALQPLHHIRIEPHRDSLLHWLVHPARAHSFEPCLHSANRLLPRGRCKLRGIGVVDRPGLGQLRKFSAYLRPHLGIPAQLIARNHAGRTAGSRPPVLPVPPFAPRGSGLSLHRRLLHRYAPPRGGFVPPPCRLPANAPRRSLHGPAQRRPTRFVRQRCRGPGLPTSAFAAWGTITAPLRIPA